MGVPAPTGKVLAGDGEKAIADDEKRDGDRLLSPAPDA